MDRKEVKRISHGKSTAIQGTHEQIRKGKATFIGHVMRKKETLHLVATGKMEGKRGRGRPRMKMLRRLVEWSGQLNEIELLRLASHRHMVANAGLHGTR